ncbi:MAG: sensor domain-containing diguanylate cyclase [Candidatus Omnitrophica bacterium]|nr:sensor domain-containing diguanylate cyclase [Candidatus Omnitrophota bacterium]
MYPQNYKIIRIAAAIILFVIAIFILKIAVPYAFILMTLSLLMIWQGGGPFAGLVLFFISIPLIIFASYITKSHIYNFQILIMLAAAVPSHLFYKKATAGLLDKNKESENIQEQHNIISSQTAKDRELTQALLKKLDRYNKLKGLGEVFNTKLSLKDIYNIITEKSFEIIGKADEAKLFIVSGDRQNLEVCSTKNGKEGNSHASDSFNKWVLNKAQPLLISDATRDFRFDYEDTQPQPGYLSIIIVPMMIQQRIIGLLRLGSRKRAGFCEEDLRLLDFISDLASAAINNARLYMQTEELAITDGLTGLYVHRYFKERLSEEFNRCRKNSHMPLSIIMLDIDHFKDYNDKYGHAAGDKVLKGISEALRKHTMPNNILARYGGEEFVVLFPGEPKENIIPVAEAIRKKIQSMMFVLRRQETKVTVSVGVAGFPQDAASSEEELLKRVDFLLYKAKKEGRNKICVS